MTKRITAKHKIDRRLSVNLWGRPKSPFNLRKYRPGQHGQKHAGKISDYGTQLQAKQKLKGYYGNLNERQFSNCFKEALRLKGNSGENLIGLLEKRLDTVVYRSKFVPTVFSARQFINHGHVKVNGKRVNIASYMVNEGDVIEVRDKKVSKELANQFLEKLGYNTLPEYLEFEKETLKGKVKRIAENTETNLKINELLVVEYYSRR